MDQKRCADCKHATARYANITFCNHPTNLVVSPVDGALEYDRACSGLRDSDKKCGPSAAWFEPKVPA